MARSTGNKKFVCKFCGQEFVRFAGNVYGAKKYDYCSKKCATLARYRAHNNTPFPSNKQFLDFWNELENKLWIDRTIAGFLHRHPNVRPIEAQTESMLIVARAMRFTGNRKSIIKRLKYGLFDFYVKDICGLTYKHYQSYDVIKQEIDEEMECLEFEYQQTDVADKIDFNYFKREIIKSQLKCMRVLECVLKDMPRADIAKQFDLKRTSDIDTHVINAVNALRAKMNDEYNKPKEKLYPLKDEIKEDRLNGMSVCALARVYQVSKSTMSNFIKKYEL